ncbi:hypothetical protein C2857_000127 [Epichloe festucae Fl1]|uniref:Uncharacterized protein n=1 Tax=Epichloe festucae (strain Fl1) TaxID=877507 RepID=A0A7S9KTX0_EPIFF|nr:hypothetical protein C2857_000127 [Epichloe festucae Fl1]
MASEPNEIKRAEFAEKGRQLHHDLLEAIRKHGNEFKEFPYHLDRYFFLWDDDDTLALDDCDLAAFHDAEVPTNGYKFCQVRNLDNDQAQGIYQMYIQKKGEAIVCTDNRSDRDILTTSRLFFSDLLAIAFQNAVSTSGNSSKNLETIWRIWVENLDTRMVINHICPIEGTTRDIDTSDDDFFALLGTVNGKTIPRMLATYPQYFGRRIVTKARVINHRGRQFPSICWFLKEAPTKEPTKRQQRKHRRELSKASRKSMQESDTI